MKFLLTAGWIVGSAVAAGFLLYANLSFWQKLRHLRRRYPVENCSLEVYLVDKGLSSPCLFGLFRPAIYLTPAALTSPARLRHVLAHEEAHARHLDHLWTLLRGVCLVIYWFDPLVWLASSAAKTDCELACDESVLARLGEAERVPYGQTLLSLIPVGRAGNPMLTATTMAAGKKQLKDRFSRIARKPRQFAAAVLAAQKQVYVQPRGLCHHAARSVGGAEIVPGQYPGVGGTELDHQVLSVVVGHQSNVHGNQSFLFRCLSQKRGRGATGSSSWGCAVPPDGGRCFGRPGPRSRCPRGAERCPAPRTGAWSRPPG